MGEAVQKAVRHLAERRHLGADETREAVAAIMAGGVPETLTAAFLMGLRVKGETEEELLGCVQAMQAMGRSISPRRRPLVDTCGTGGDGLSTFNISTVTAFVVAGAGATVAKHGNRSVSSRSGSADLLEALHVPLLERPEDVERCIDQIGIGFMFAPYFHPAIGNVSPIRRALGVRTVFNLLGPLSNPARAECQLIGVYASEWVLPVARVAGMLGVRSCLVVHGGGGADELTLAGPSQAALLQNGQVRSLEIEPVMLGFDHSALSELGGGEAAENAVLALELLRGQAPGPRTDTVLLNAAAALWVAGLAQDLTEGLVRARQSLQSGAALSRLDELKAFQA